MEGQKSGELTPLQETYARLYYRQVRALQVPCPYCQAELSRQDICTLVCKKCERIFKVDILLLNLALKKCCQQCFGNLETRDKDTVYCPACDLEYTVDQLIKDA